MIQADGQAPYAPPATIMHVIERHRQVEIPKFDVATLERIGVSESLAARTVQALRLLGLVDEEGNPTDAFEILRKSTTPEFQPTLARIVMDAYQPVFSILDPRDAAVTDIEDAFRHFKPAGQRSRMVTLFIGLLDGAGLRGEGLRKEPVARKKGPATRKPISLARSKTKPEVVSSLAVAPDQVRPTRFDDGDTYRIQLVSGGSVSVVMDVNLFQMSADDRAFIIDLVDRLKNYESAEST